jgi:hypothetical protein
MKRNLLLLVSIVSVVSAAHGQGSIQLRNSAVTRMQLLDSATGTTVPVPTTVALYYGVFVNGSSILVGPPGTSSTSVAGIIDTQGPVYPIPTVQAGQTAPLQVRAWSVAYGLDWQAAQAAGAYYGETDVRNITFGDPVLPTIIWQPANGTNPNRFHPIIVTGSNPPPDELNINDITVAEGSNGVVNAVFTVRLSSPSSQTVTVDFATQDGSAVAGEDYVGTNGTVTFAPGETARSITVAVTADVPAEGDETFSVVLSNSSNAYIRRSTGTCVVTEARITDVRIDTAVVFHTLAGRHYVVESSSDLTTWTPLPSATDVLGVGGPMTVHDQGVGCSGVRYYRTRLLNQ